MLCWVLFAFDSCRDRVPDRFPAGAPAQYYSVNLYNDAFMFSVENDQLKVSKVTRWNLGKVSNGLTDAIKTFDDESNKYALQFRANGVISKKLFGGLDCAGKKVLVPKEINVNSIVDQYYAGNGILFVFSGNWKRGWGDYLADPSCSVGYWSQNRGEITWYPVGAPGLTLGALKKGNSPPW